MVSQRIVRLIRHGESQANAGGTTDDPDTIGLTHLGEQQAETIAKSFLEPPDIILHSRMTRARLTAMPTIKRFKGMPVRELDIHEFTYLDPLRCQGTTRDQRKTWVDEYWTRCDPNYFDDGWTWKSDGEWTWGNPNESRCESFSEFINRVRKFVIQLSELHEYKRIAVFGHGQHLVATRIAMMSLEEVVPGLLHYKDARPTTSKLKGDMRVFPSLCRDMHLANGESFFRFWDGRRWRPQQESKPGW